jgi:XapX domain-containing protein
MKLGIAFALSFSIGAACKYFDIPCPAPNVITGALLVVATSLGYVAVGYLQSR